MRVMAEDIIRSTINTTDSWEGKQVIEKVAYYAYYHSTVDIYQDEGYNTVAGDSQGSLFLHGSNTIHGESRFYGAWFYPVAFTRFYLDFRIPK